jgi:hypothetical protein
VRYSTCCMYVGTAEYTNRKGNDLKLAELD